jgi:hypothetical protein
MLSFELRKIIFMCRMRCCMWYIKNRIIFPIKLFLKDWFWYKPQRMMRELWKYGYILSWDERTDRGRILSI